MRRGAMFLGLLAVLLLGTVTAGNGAETPPAAADARRQRLAKLLAAQDRAAIPLLEEDFQRTKGKTEKQQIATLLIGWGVRDPYVDFLLAEAEPSIASDMPFPLGFDEQGELVRKVYTEEFQAWCRVHGVDANTAAWEAVYGAPADVGFLARARDPRAAKALSRALLSSNPMIAYQAARGLALLGDRGAVDTIIRRLERGPKAVSTLMAHALVYYDDPRARQATEEFFTDKQLLEQMRRSVELERGRERGPSQGR